MKKLIFTCLLALVLVVPFPAKAQTLSQDEVNAQLLTLINSLMQQVLVLLQKLQAIEAQQLTDSQTLGAVQSTVQVLNSNSNPTPIPTPAPQPSPAPATPPAPSWKLFELDDPYGPNQKGFGWKAMKDAYNRLGPSILPTYCDNKWQDAETQEGCLAAKVAIEAIQ